MGIREWTEKERYGGIAQDEFFGPTGSFQYSENIDTMNSLKGIQLSSKVEEITVSGIVAYAKYDKDNIIKAYSNGDIKKSNNSSFGTDTLIANSGVTGIKNITVFREEIRVFGNTVAKVTMGGVVTVETPSSGRTTVDQICVLQYRNTTLVVGAGDKLWTYDVLLGTRTKVRDFYDGVKIVGVATVGNTIAVYTNYNGLDSRIFYLGGTFDVEDNGVLDTVVLDGIVVKNVGKIGNRTFIACKDDTGGERSSIYEISGYSKKLIYESKPSPLSVNFPEYFRYNTLNQPLPSDGERLFIPALDGIRSYGKKNQLVNDSLAMLWGDGDTYISSIVFGEYLYLSTSTQEKRIFLGYRNLGYTDEQGILVSRIFDGGRVWQSKEIKGIRIGYQLDKYSANPGSIKVYFRNDRPSYKETGGWVEVAEITDNTKFEYYVEATNEDMLADFNLLEYKIEINRGSDTLVSPVVYEHTVIYSDIERIYEY